MRSPRRRAAAFLAVGALATALAVLAWATSVFTGADFDSIDARFSVRGTQPPADDLVLVDIDDRTFSALDEQWPFPRTLHAEVVRRLTDAGARAIAYDVQFTEPTTRAEDNALIRAVDDADNVVLATTEVDERGRSNVFGGEAVLDAIGARAANTLIEPDSDAVWRRFPHSEQGLESFAVATAEEAGGGAVEEGDFDADDGAYIDYSGPPGTIPTVSFSDVLRGRADPALLEEAIVVVGASAPTLQDIHTTPMGGGRLMSGGEIQANAISTVLDGVPLRPSPAGLDVVLIALLGFVAPAAGIRMRPEPAVGLALLAGIVYMVAAQLAFDAGTLLPVVYPILALGLGAVGTLGLHYVLSAFERQRVRDAFARFVPENVVEQVLARTDGGELSLGGVRRECTILFSDIRGFTSFAESRPPEVVVEVLNRYLGEMTDAIMDNGGTLVAYMGDGIMAVFGAPIEQADHADRALAAAREMLEERLPAFCEWMRGEGYGEGFRIGIGINSGEAMSGQVGSLRRMEYTTIGDTTNTAARLESMTKGTPHQLMIADSTRNTLLGVSADLVLVGDLAVRGREAEIRVWTLAGSVTAGPPPAPAGETNAGGEGEQRDWSEIAAGGEDQDPGEGP